MKYVDVLNASGRAAVERLRNNPKSVFKYNGIDGAIWAITLLFKAFATEIALGYSDKIDVELLNDNIIRIIGNNRGLYIIDGGCIKARLFSQFLPFFDDAQDYKIEPLMGARPGFLFNNSNDKDKAPEWYNEFYSWTAESFSALNFASEFFDIISCRGGKKYHLLIKERRIASYEIVATEEVSGTSVEFKLSEDVFGSINITAEMLIPMLKYASEKFPSAKFSLNGERIVAGESKAFATENDET